MNSLFYDSFKKSVHSTSKLTRGAFNIIEVCWYITLLNIESIVDFCSANVIRWTHIKTLRCQMCLLFSNMLVFVIFISINCFINILTTLLKRRNVSRSSRILLALVVMRSIYNLSSGWYTYLDNNIHICLHTYRQVTIHTLLTKHIVISHF